MIRGHAVAVVILLMVAACAGPQEGLTGTSTTTSSTMAARPSATSATSVTQAAPTSTTAPPHAAPAYLTYGWDGVTRFQAGSSELLVVEPVTWAGQDGAGGIVFRSATDEPGWAWLAADAQRPRSLDLGDGGWNEIRLVFGLEGRPSALVSRTPEGGSPCDPSDFAEELTILDLATGDERSFMCREEGGDGGEVLTSFGGGLFAAVSWVAAGAGGTDRLLSFYDINGGQVVLDHNPFAESCAPCQLSVELSPDGTSMAYALWPTAYWEQPLPAGRDHAAAFEAWYEDQRDIQTEVAVIDLASGLDLFRTSLAANSRLVAFDGRFLTVSGGPGRKIFDIATGRVNEAPPLETGAGGFWTVVLASLDNSAMGYDAAQDAANSYADRLNVMTGVLWSDGLLTLNPGYWAVFTGHFSDREAAAGFCNALATDCYARYVAAVATADADLARSMLVLEPEGLGLVRFGQTREEVLAVMERLMGSPPSDPGEQADWVEYMGWETFGLFLGFSRPMWTEFDGVARFVGWQYDAGSAESDLRTAAGVGVGVTGEELKTVYGPGLEVPQEPDECRGWAVQLIDSDAGIVVLLDGAQVVRTIEAGIGVGC